MLKLPSNRATLLEPLRMVVGLLGSALYLWYLLRSSQPPASLGRPRA